MLNEFAIKLENFYFASAHFLIFENGQRESLHGHNFAVKVKIYAQTLKNDLVFDFLQLEPIINEICQQLDHRVLLPQNSKLSIQNQDDCYLLKLANGEQLTLPQRDCQVLPIANTTAELLAKYIAQLIQKKTLLSQLCVEVEEMNGRAASYTLKREM